MRLRRDGPVTAASQLSNPSQANPDRMGVVPVGEGIERNVLSVPALPETAEQRGDGFLGSSSRRQ